MVIGVKLTIAGCPLRAQIKKDVETRIATHPGVTKVKINWDEMTADERTEVMSKARWNARENAPDTQIPATTRILAIASGKGGVGKSSVTVNLAAAMAMQGYTVGVLDADIWGFSVPRMLGLGDRLEAQPVAGSDKPLIIPNERKVGRGLLKVVSTGFLVEDEGTALMWRGLMLTKAVEQFLRDVHWGDLDYLLIDMPPGTGDVQMGLARMLPAHRPDHRDHSGDLGAEGGHPRRRHGSAIVPPDRRRDREHEHVHLRPRRRATRSSEPAAARALADEIGAELLGQVPIEPSVAAGGDSGEPVALAGNGPAADAFRAIARQDRHRQSPPREHGRLLRPPARNHRTRPRPQTDEAEHQR